MRLATFVFFVLLCACQGREESLGRARHELCSREWWRNATEAEVEATVRSHRDSVNAACDERGNRPVHLALGVEGILSEDGFHATAVLIRTGAELSAVNRAGESAVTLAEDRFRHMLARWDAAVEKLCQGIDVMDQAVQRERWENSMYYLVRTDSGLETLEEVRTRTNASRERPPDCTGQPRQETRSDGFAPVEWTDPTQRGGRPTGRPRRGPAIGAPHGRTEPNIHQSVAKQ